MSPRSTSETVKEAVAAVSGIRLLPHLAAYRLASDPVRRLVDEDLDRWAQILGLQGDRRWVLVRLLTFFPEYRNLYYFRLGHAWRAVLSTTARPMESLFITTPRSEVGGGLFLQHGFATVISAASVGRNCWINQQVTIGFNDRGECPVLEDGVSVKAGGKVIGGVRVGAGSVVGANAVVVKDVPPDSVAVGVPARVLPAKGARS